MASQIFVNSCKVFNKMALGCVCFVTFASFTSTGNSDYSPTPSESIIKERVYTDADFYRDAYNYRVRNNLDVPDFYYEVLNLENPKKPIMVAQPIHVETARDRNKKLIPDWVLRGILKHETRSYYTEDGDIVYVDKRRGRNGERGAFQMRKICFNQIEKPGEQFWKVEKDVYYAEEMAVRYLLYLFNGPAKQNWKTAVGMYNTGPSNFQRLSYAANRYYNEVKKKGNL